MKSAGVLVAVAVPLALSGCLSMAPRYHRPAAPIADAFPADAPAIEREALNTNVQWRDIFANADLQRLIELALENSRDLRGAVLRVEEARALRGIQRADRFPEIDAAAGGTRSRTPASVSIIGQSYINSAYQVTANVASWEVDFWGRIRSLDIAAIENYLASDATRRAFTVSLVAQVADAWLATRELDRRLDLARQTVASRQESFRIFRRRWEEGAATRLELSQVETLLTQAQTLGAQLEQTRATNNHALSLLVGTPLDLPARAEMLEASPEPVRGLGAGAPSDLLVQRPDIIAAEHQLRAAHANIGAARAAFFPRVSLTGDFGTASSELENLFGADSRAWSYTPSIAIPLFTGGRLRANLDLAHVRREQAVTSYELAIQTAFRDVADALSANRWLNEQLDIQRRALSAQQERARLAQARYESGAVAYLEVLEAQRDLLDAEQALVQVERAVQSSHVSLFAAVGGGALGAEER